jgi:hypothetical protein
MHQDKDRSAKWLLSHHGDSILRLAGMGGFTAWKHLPAELVAPRRTFDGLLQVQYPCEPEPRLVLIEIESFAGSDADRQVFDDLMLVALEYRKLPEVVTLIMKPKGHVRVSGRYNAASPSGSTTITGQWPVVYLWDLEARDLLDTGDIGLIPWVPLTRSDQPIGEVLAECVARIGRVDIATERAGLIAVTYLLTSFAHPKINLFSIFGGVNMVIDFESVGMKELGEAYKEKHRIELQRETLIENIHQILEERFGNLPNDQAAKLDEVVEITKLRKLFRFAVKCPALDDFFTEATK